MKTRVNVIPANHYYTDIESNANISITTMTMHHCVELPLKYFLFHTSSESVVLTINQDEFVPSHYPATV